MKERGHFSRQSTTDALAKVVMGTFFDPVYLKNKDISRQFLTEEQIAAFDSLVTLDSGQWQIYTDLDFQIRGWRAFWENVFKGSLKSRVLDFGAGPTWAEYTGSKIGYSEVTSLDINTDNVKKGFKGFYEILGTKSDLWDGKNMPYNDEAFDCVISRSSLNKTVNTDLVRQFEELIRVSKKNAVWYIAPFYTVYRTFLNPNASVKHGKTISSPEFFSAIKKMKEKNITVIGWDWDRRHYADEESYILDMVRDGSAPEWMVKGVDDNPYLCLISPDLAGEFYSDYVSSKVYSWLNFEEITPGFTEEQRKELHEEVLNNHIRLIEPECNITPIVQSYVRCAGAATLVELKPAD